MFSLLLLLACLSDQLELSEHACVHLLVVRVGVIAVASCGGGIWAGALALGSAAIVVTDALIATLVIRKSSEIMQRVAELPSGDARHDVALRALRLWGHLLSTSGPGFGGSAQGWGLGEGDAGS